MIAYFLLLHRYPEQFERMLKAIYDIKNIYLIHVDKNSDKDVKDYIKLCTRNFQNIHFLESKSALWGGYSLVDAELRAMKTLLNLNKEWDYYINLSGQDFPLKSQSEIATFLSHNSGKEFIKVADQALIRPETMHRIRKYVLEFQYRLFETFISRRFLKNAKPYIGNQWKIVTRSFCDYVINDTAVHRFKKFYANTFIADEAFFQTVLMNSHFKDRLVNSDYRMIDWIDIGDRKLRPKIFTMKDIARLLSSKDLFARKFDATIDYAVMSSLELSLSVKERSDLILVK